MKRIVFILNVPAFYKINLLKRLSEYYDITAIILGATQQVVSSDAFSDCGFKTIILSRDDMDVKWKGMIRTFKLSNLLRKLRYDYLVYSGWDNIDLVANCFLSKRAKNCVISESSIFESETTGLKAFIKKVILRRFHAVLASGRPHEDLLKSLGYNGRIYITGSVGINTPLPCPQREKAGDIIKYIYIGRLIELKNIRFLIEVFNELGKPLTIVGDGPLKAELQEIAGPNIDFAGFASRKAIGQLLSQHECLVLPSLKETWGLVVEEALQCGIPVIASDRVGSSVDMICAYDSGLVFNPDSKPALIEAVGMMEEKYDYYRNNAMNIDFPQREKNYIEAFKSVFDK